MVKRTDQTISRTCFVWKPTHDVPKTRECVAWIEILRIDGKVSYNALSITDSVKKDGKFQKNTVYNVILSHVLATIKEIGVKETKIGFEPVSIDPAPEWIEEFFEILARMLEAKNKTLGQFEMAGLEVLVEAAYMEAKIPKTLPPATQFGPPREFSI